MSDPGLSTAHEIYHAHKINVEMPKVVGILTFISTIYSL